MGCTRKDLGWNKGHLGGKRGFRVGIEDLGSELTPAAMGKGDFGKEKGFGWEKGDLGWKKEDLKLKKNLE